MGQQKKTILTNLIYSHTKNICYRCLIVKYTIINVINSKFPKYTNKLYVGVDYVCSLCVCVCVCL